MIARAAILVGCSLSALVTTIAYAAGRPVATPPVLTPTTNSLDRSMVLPEGVSPTQPTEPYLDLHIVMVNGKLYNPATDRDEPVRLRSYQGTSVNPATPFISPMIETRPGETASSAQYRRQHRPRPTGTRAAEP